MVELYLIWILLLITNIIDVVTTTILIKNFGWSIELNPFAKKIQNIGKLNLIKWAIVCFYIPSSYYTSIENYNAACYLGAGLCLFYVIVAINNLYVYHRSKNLRSI